MNPRLLERTRTVIGSANIPLTLALSHIVDDCEGLEGLLHKFESHGLGCVVESWVGTGPNQALTCDQVRSVLGEDLIQRAAQQELMTPESLCQQLSVYLPLVVEELSADGVMTHAGWWSRGLLRARDFFGLHTH